MENETLLIFKQQMVKLLFYLTGIFFLLAFSNPSFAQDPPQYGTPFNGVPDTRDVNMYQVHIRPYSAAGNLQGIIARLDNIKALGTNVVYLMPIYPHGTDSRSTASPYCIKDFKAVASEYGSLSDLRQLVDGAHSRGMAVMLDFAVNGTSWDHPWITQHPDWYIRNGGVIQQLANFNDIAALDFNNTAMRAAMVDAMRYWIFAANIDGYRCDFANNPPLDFWTNTINNLRSITSHKLLMLAEGDRLQNFQTGFDMNFGDKWYYDAIKQIAGGAPVSAIQTTTNVEYTYANSNQQVARYTANHDTETETTALNLFQNHDGVVANFLVCAYMKGVPFLTSGQEVDFNSTIPWPYQTTKINWNANPGAAADFAKILNFRTASEAIRRGTMTNYSNNDVCAFTKISGADKVVVMTNLRNSSKTFVIPSAMAGSYIDAYSNASVTLTSGATQTLGAYQYIVLTNANVPVVAVTGVSVSPTSASFKAGTTQQLTATITPANATNQSVTWTSGNTAVATVSSTGLVTGVAAGSATITVKTVDGNKTATSAISITPASTFTVNFYKPSSWGSGIQIYWWAAQPSGVLADGSWPGVLMTNSGGGWYSYTFTNITSTNLIFNDSSNQTADLNRDKNGWYLNNTWYDSNPGAPVQVTGVTVSPSSATVNTGTTQQLTATVAPANATNKAVSWSSNNTGVATVNSSGLVNAVSAGTALITVTTQDGNKTATCTITVPGTSGNTTYYQIKNRWQANTFLYDAGNGQVKYGTNATGSSYQWAKVDAGSGYFVLKNRATGNIMHVEHQNGSVECSTGDVTWWSAQWSLPATGDGWNYIQNRWQTAEMVNIEGLTGYAQYNGAQSGWYSAMWQFVNPVVINGLAADFDKHGDLKLYFDETNTKNEITIYPNPSSDGRFNVSLKGTKPDEPALIQVFDLTGKKIFETKLSSSGVVDHPLHSGTYLVNIKNNSVNITRSLIVE